MAEPQDAPSSLESSSSSSSLPVEPSYPIRFDRNFDYSQRIVTSVAPPAGPGPLDPEKLWDEERRPRIDVVRDWLFREGRFRVEDALEIVEKATAVFCQEPNLLQLQSPLTICGDVHGQYYDLMKLFEVGGDPSETTYLFLGDYVDRGMFSIEIVFLLYCHKICFPKTFFMIRGNHECRHLTEYFTFKEECKIKYGDIVYDAIMDSFDALPLAALMNSQFLCVHGGISPSIVSLETIHEIDRFQEPPASGPMCDLLWSDPVNEYDDEEDATFEYNDARGCSYYYGFKAVCDFLNRNNLICIIRAHEAQDHGYKMYKRNPKNKFPTVITLFSAPNYLDAYGNKGAVMRYANNVMNIRQFVSQPHPYWLPNFMDVLTWSAPFVAEKIVDVLLNILKICDDEEQVAQEKAARQKAIRQKVLLMGKLARMYGVLRTEREAIIQLKGLSDGHIPRGLLQGGSAAIHEYIGNFQKVREADRTNERRPKMIPKLRRSNSSSASLNAAILQRQASEPVALVLKHSSDSSLPAPALIIEESDE